MSIPTFIDTTPYQQPGWYLITRDGEPVDYTRNPLAWFHRQHSYSMGHALQSEGYTCTRVSD